MDDNRILNEDATLARIVGRLVDGFHPESLYLFGSRARGEVNADSDYDIVMVVGTLSQPAYRVSQDAHTSLWDIGAAADIVVWSRGEFARRLHLKASFPATVVREGSSFMPHDPARVDASLDPLCRFAVFVVSSRYPGDPDEPDAGDVQAAIDVAAEVLDAVVTRMPPDVRPSSVAV